MVRASDERAEHDAAQDAEAERPRSTFLEVGEVLRRTRRYAERAQDVLIRRMREASDEDDRIRIFLDTVEQQRAELEAAIDRCTEQAPSHVLETVVQYTVEIWDEEPAAPRCSSIEEATRWMIELDDRLVEFYQELAEKSENDEVRELFGRLVDLVRNHDRTLSSESQAVRYI